MFEFITKHLFNYVEMAGHCGRERCLFGLGRHRSRVERGGAGQDEGVAGKNREKTRFFLLEFDTCVVCASWNVAKHSFLHTVQYFCHP